MRGDECAKEKQVQNSAPAGAKILCRKGLSVLKEPVSVLKLRLLKFISCLGHSVTRFQMENSFPVELAK